MARRPYLSRFQCGHDDGCREFQTYESDTRADQAALYGRYGNGKWRCIRHSQPDSVLGLTNLRRVYEIASDERPHGVFWGHSGFVSGPGFRAFAKDFPAGTVLRVTAEVIPPTSAEPDDRAERVGEGPASTEHPSSREPQ